LRRNQLFREVFSKLVSSKPQSAAWLQAAQDLAPAVAKNPPRSVRATVCTRCWYMDQLEREVAMQTAPLKLYLSEDLQDAVRPFAEKRPPGPFKGH
jgi:enoyl-CoA hydratase/carnithine racemase